MMLYQVRHGKSAVDGVGEGPSVSRGAQGAVKVSLQGRLGAVSEL